MKRLLIPIVLASVLASIPVFAGTPEATAGIIGGTVAPTEAAAPALPQFRRRYRRRYVIVRRRHYYRRRHYRPIYVIRHRRRRI